MENRVTSACHSMGNDCRGNWRSSSIASRRSSIASGSRPKASANASGASALRPAASNARPSWKCVSAVSGCRHAAVRNAAIALSKRPWRYRLCPSQKRAAAKAGVVPWYVWRAGNALRRRHPGPARRRHCHGSADTVPVLAATGLHASPRLRRLQAGSVHTARRRACSWRPPRPRRPPAPRATSAPPHAPRLLRAGGSRLAEATAVRHARCAYCAINIASVNR